MFFFHGVYTVRICFPALNFQREKSEIPFYKWRVTLNTTTVPLNTTTVPLNTSTVPLNTTTVPLDTTTVPLNDY